MNLLWEAFGLSLLGSLAIIAILGLIGYLLRTWFSERIRQSIRLDFSLGLEQYKDEISKITTQHHAMHSAANAAMIEGQRVSAEWRIKAADEMWREVLRLRNETSNPLTMLDIFMPDEYQLFVTDNRVRSSVLKIEDSQVLANPSIEQVRPFLGEKLFALLFMYRAIVGRICFLLERDVQRGHVTPWFEDDGIHQLLREVLTKEEMKRFEELTDHRVRWMRNLLEGKILDDLRRVTGGTQSVDDGLEQASRILHAVQSTDSRQ